MPLWLALVLAIPLGLAVVGSVAGLYLRWLGSERPWRCRCCGAGLLQAEPIIGGGVRLLCERGHESYLET